MVAGDDKEGNSPASYLQDHVYRHLDEAGLDTAAVEDVTTVQNNVDLAPERWLEGCPEALPEIGSASASGCAGLCRHVETEVGIGEEENPDHGWSHHPQKPGECFSLESLFCREEQFDIAP